MDPTHRYSPAGSADAFRRGMAEATRFFMGQADVQRALAKLVRELEALQIPYAIAGAMALNWYGYRRVTVDVDVLFTRAGLEAFKAQALGRGYVEKFPGSKGLRDAEHNVNIDVLIAGDFPGDGKPKPVAFPDPLAASVQTSEGRFLALPRFVELKLASGISAPHRAKDLADVLELVRAARLERRFGQELDESVRAKFDELWLAADSAPAEE